MPELRKHYITDRWVIIATERAKRPSAFHIDRVIFDDGTNCPFCPGREDATPPEVLAYRKEGAPNTGGWWIRVVPNKYPALSPDEEFTHIVTRMTDGMKGYGRHEVIIESPQHKSYIPIMSDFQVREIICAYVDRVLALKDDPKIKYVLIFKNHGRAAGASLLHPHSQLIATPMIPKRILEELQGSRFFYENTGGCCVFCELVDFERNTERFVTENKDFIAFTPYASTFPFEVWILPKRHEPDFSKIKDDERTTFAQILKDILGRLDKIFGNPPFNYVIHTAPCDGHEYPFFHWHLEILPKLVTPAGFEFGSGMYVNPTPPEEAARYLREAL